MTKPGSKVSWVVWIGRGVLVLGICLFGLLWICARLVFTSGDKEARFTTTRGSIAMIEQAVQIFRAKHNGKLPESLEELTRGTDDLPGLLKEGALSDSWGTPFRYVKQGGKIKIVSAGPDRELDTRDDITN